jgi:putative tricarboxylic transport membrane protein
VRAANLITAGLLALLGGIVVVDALRLGIGWGTDGPKSGFFPFWLATILIVTTCLILVQNVRRSRRPFVTREQLGPVMTVLWPAMALVVATHVIGLYLASAVYMAAYMRAIGRHRWITTVALSIAVPVVAFAVFERWFLVPMPKGPLELWLGL